jgi:hypothetical protein
MVEDGGTRPGGSLATDTLRATYREILAYSERLDDKLRSLITALAFLTTAGISLFVFGSNRTLVDLQWDGRSWNVANFFFLFFIGCVVLSLSSALVALDPTTHRPRFFPSRDDGPPSVLHPHGLLADQWWESGKPHRPLARAQEALAESYRQDSYEIALRVQTKVQRSRNTEAFMSTAIVALFCLAGARLPESADKTRENVILAVLVGFTLFPLGTFFRMRWAELPGVSKRDLPTSIGFAVRTTLFYLIPFLVSLTLAVMSVWDNAPIWPTVVYLMLWITFARLLPASSSAHWISLFVASVGTCLAISYSLFPQHPILWGTLLRADAASTLRSVRGQPQPVLCVRIHGLPRKTAAVQVFLTGVGGRKIVKAFHIALDGRGIGVGSVLVGRQGAYGINARLLSDPVFIYLTARVPAATQEAAPFTCR